MSNNVVFAHPLAGADWGFSQAQLVDYNVAISRPRSIAAVPVYFDNPQSYGYWEPATKVDLRKFKLVLITSIEYQHTQDIHNWAANLGLTNYAIATGATYKNYQPSDNEIYRPWWAFNIANSNSWQDISGSNRPYQFDMLLGARRPHRDFAIKAFAYTNLLEKSIVTYRDCFKGSDPNVDSCDYNQQYSVETKKYKIYPYVSPNLDPAWEVANDIDNTVSSRVPWEIYRRCNYSVICETNAHGQDFFMSEKTGKMLFGRRMFLHFGSTFFLQNLRQHGFETFGDIIDESYDTIPREYERFKKVVEQAMYLSQQDANLVLQKVAPRLAHNHNRLLEWQTECRQRMNDLIQSKLN